MTRLSCRSQVREKGRGAQSATRGRVMRDWSLRLRGCGRSGRARLVEGDTPAGSRKWPAAVATGWWSGRSGGSIGLNEHHCGIRRIEQVDIAARRPPARRSRAPVGYVRGPPHVEGGPNGTNGGTPSTTRLVAASRGERWGQRHIVATYARLGRRKGYAWQRRDSPLSLPRRVHHTGRGTVHCARQCRGRSGVVSTRARRSRRRRRRGLRFAVWRLRASRLSASRFLFHGNAKRKTSCLFAPI